MIWGAGTADGTDHARLQEFKGISHTPSYIIGFEEPDCAAGSGSAGFDVATGKYIPLFHYTQQARPKFRRIALGSCPLDGPAKRC